MALWQYAFIVIPGGIDYSNELELQFDEDVFWVNHLVHISLFDELEEALPKAKSWNKDLIIYGTETSNCFEVLGESNYVESISFRIDFTSNYEKVLNVVLEFLQLNNFLLIGEDKNLLPFNYLQVKATIESSPQFARYKKLSHPGF